jgi:hypothetical protein
MSQLQTNVSDIKTVAKNLVRELKTMNFDISHSSALNLASRSLGYKNYQTYKGLIDKKKNHQSDDFNFLAESLSSIDIEKDRLEKYPSIKRKLVPFGQTDKYNIFIDMELANGEESHYLLFILKESYTGRVFFSPEYDTFSFFIYPNIQDAKSDYAISLDNIDSKHLHNKYFNILQHTNGKNWMNPDIMHDLMNLMNQLLKDRESLKSIVEKYTKEGLSNKYNESDYS